MKWREYLVHDKDGNVGMAIYPPKNGAWYRVHFPRVESFSCRTPLLQDRSTFHEMRLTDIGYMLMAYSEDEFKKFDDFLKGVMKDGE